MEQINIRRSNFNIIADILKLGRSGKTNIMYSCDLSFHQLQKYLKFLTESGFMEIDDQDDRKQYQPTTKGEELLSLMTDVIDLLQPEESTDSDVNEVEPVMVGMLR